MVTADIDYKTHYNCPNAVFCLVYYNSKSAHGLTIWTVQTFVVLSKNTVIFWSDLLSKEMHAMCQWKIWKKILIVNISTRISVKWIIMQILQLL